jgi:hypothetical protein
MSTVERAILVASARDDHGEPGDLHDDWHHRGLAKAH